MPSSNLENDRSSVIFEASDFERIPGAKEADIFANREAIESQPLNNTEGGTDFIDAGRYITKLERRRHIFVVSEAGDEMNLCVMLPKYRK